MIHSIETGNFRLDGGAIFGVVPKVLWNPLYPADDNNRVNLAMRCLYVEDGDKKILVDTGIGNKQDEKFFSYYFLNGEDTLDKSLKNIGVNKEDITDVVVTHLHFDHVGDAVRRNDKADLYLTFPNAVHHIHKLQWEEANNPNSREKASFLKENILPIAEKGKLNLVDSEKKLSENVHLKAFFGHTKGLMLPLINLPDGRKLFYCGDLIPLVSNIPISWISAFDLYPVTSMEEKETVLKEAYENNWILFFEHDVYHECCTIKKTEKGYRAAEVFKKLTDVFTN